MTTPATTTTEDDAKPEAGAEAVAKLTRALEAEREAHKATKGKLREFRTSVASPFGLSEDAEDALILSAIADVEKTVADRTAAITAERDVAQAKATDVETRWASEKVEAALHSAFEKSGANPENAEDYLALARPLFTVDDKGAVVTKADAANTVPGVDPSAWVHGELKANRPHWWPLSTGGGAIGGRGAPRQQGDDSAFRTGNVTAQMRYADQYGTEAAVKACQRASVPACPCPRGSCEGVGDEDTLRLVPRARGVVG